MSLDLRVLKLCLHSLPTPKKKKLKEAEADNGRGLCDVTRHAQCNAGLIHSIDIMKLKVGGWSSNALQNRGWLMCWARGTWQCRKIAKMAPKRAANKVVSSVVTRTRRVVEVSVIGDKGKEAKFIEEVDKETEEEETVDIIEKPVKSIPVEDLQAHKQQLEELQKQREDDDEETQEAQRLTEEPKIDQITTPPRNQEVPPKQQKEEREETRAREKPDEARGVEGERKRGRKRGRMRLKEGGGGREGYRRYLFRVLKQVHPGMGISSKAMTVLNNMMSDMFERLAVQAARLLRYTGRKTMTSREIHGAVKLVLPGELGRHAVSEGIKAVSSYMPRHK